jgi:hypothetical protein
VPALQGWLRRSFRLSLSRGKHVDSAEGKFVRAGQLGILSMQQTVRIPARLSMPLVTKCRPDTANYYPPGIRPSIRRVTHATAPEPPTKVFGGALLSASLFAQLRESLPREAQRYSPRLVFTIAEHGTMLATMLAKCSTPGYYILIVKTEDGQVGAFLSDAPAVGKGIYYGRPSTFVFDCGSGDVYRSAQTNTMYMAVSTTEIMVGGPRPALFIMDEFKTLVSHPCDTFASPALVGEPSGDPIHALEVFRLVI